MSMSYDSVGQPDITGSAQTRADADGQASASPGKLQFLETSRTPKQLQQEERPLWTGLEDMLKIQKMGWVMRKAAGLANIRVELSISRENESDPASALFMDIHESVSGGLSQTHEKRPMDWRVHSKTDAVLGELQIQAEFVPGVVGEGGKVWPRFEVQSNVKDEKLVKFLRGEIREDKSDSSWVVSGAEDVWVHVWVRNEKDKWAAEHIWGFEEINGKRYQSRRVVSSNEKGESCVARFVYSADEKK
ncbi:hypothetical protein BJX99DRAFT_258356 [Aspergillus californicus]